MPYHDSDPERRNLVITSLAFIVYFWAGGVPDQKIKIQLVSVDFTNTSMLAFLAWVALFWFLYRYWLKHSGQFSKNFSTELCSAEYLQMVEPYLPKELQASIATDGGEGYHIDRLYWDIKGFHAEYEYAVRVSRNMETGRIASRKGQDTERCGIHDFSGVSGWKLALKITISCMFSKPSFSSYFIPYLLFCVAVASGVYSITLVPATRALCR